MICIYCGKHSSDEYNFCEHCYKQVRCANAECRSPLKADAPICLLCGRKIGDMTSVQPSTNIYTESIRQTADSYDMQRHLQVTDEAVGIFAPLVVNQMQSRTAHQPMLTATDGGQATVYTPMPSAAVVDDAQLEVPTERTDSHGRDAHSQGKELALALFQMTDDGKLVARVRDFKGKSKKEQQERLIVLYAWAYGCICGGQPVPDREHFNFAADKAAIRDTNFRTYLVGTSTQFFNILGGTYQLTRDGEAEAARILAEIEDGSIKGVACVSSSVKTNKKRASVSKDDEMKIQLWAADEIDSGCIDIRELRSGRKCALFAIWAITVHLRKAEAVAPREAYLFLIRKYATISVTPKAFTDSLSRSGSDKYFGRTPDGLYYLTRMGQQMVDGWVSGTSIVSGGVEQSEE